MSISSILIILALFLLTALVLVQPFFASHPKPQSRDEEQYTSLLAERERAIQALQELEFDYELGKIPPEDHPALRKQLLARGAEVLRKLDAYEQKRPTSNDDNLEAMIAARRKQTRGRQ